MRAGLWGIALGTLVGALQAQTLDIRGRVLQPNGTPVADATVDLKVRGTSVKTGVDGAFAFGDVVGIQHAGGPPVAYRLEAGFLSVESDGPRRLRIDVLDGAGRVHGVLDRRLEAGPHRIALAEALPDAGADIGVYFLRLRMDGETLTHPFFHSGNGSGRSVFAPAYRMAAAKRAAVVDTLRVRKDGFRDITQAIEGYAVGNLGNLTLSPVAADGWVNLFNGKDLTGWIPMIHRSPRGVNTDSTFRPDPENNGIRVAYDRYTGDFGGGNCKCGNLYYNKFLTNYRIRVTYRFFEPQAGPNPPSWGRNNSGLMIFGIDPAKVTGDPVFPPIIEIQLLGNPSGGGSTTANYCDMGAFVNPTVTMTHTGVCGNNRDSKAPGSGKPLSPAATWTTVEADVRVDGDTKVYIWPDTVNAALIMSRPMYGGQPVTGGFLALQSESQPIVFKDILLKELPQ